MDLMRSGGAIVGLYIIQQVEGKMGSDRGIRVFREVQRTADPSLRSGWQENKSL